MEKIWEKSELRFTLLWIAGYVVGNSLSNEISNTLGIKNCVTAVFNLGVSLFLLSWINKNGLMDRYGLCKTKLPASKFLWYIPLIILPSRNLWNGVAVTLPAVDVIFSICNMIGVGCLEELLFRGFLFQAISRNSVENGIVISSISFGLGHIANRVNSCGMVIVESIWQIIFATAFGFLCAIIFQRGKSLWPCILTHAIFNVTSVFSNEAGAAGSVRFFQNVGIFLLVIWYTWVLMRILPEGRD